MVEQRPQEPWVAGSSPAHTMLTKVSRLMEQDRKVPKWQGCTVNGSKARPENTRLMPRDKFSFSVSRQNFFGFLFGWQSYD